MISIDYGTGKDINGWMILVRKVSDSFPGLKKEAALEEHRHMVLDFMGRQEVAKWQVS